MGFEETRTNGSHAGSDETTNVVRIPRDWFGPKDELVPFGPLAHPGADGLGGEGRDALEADAPLDAETFWGEGAESLHDVLDEHPAESTARSIHRRNGKLLTAAVAVLLIAGAGLTTSLLGSRQRRAALPQVASVSYTPRVAPSRLQAKAGVSARRPRPESRSRPRRLQHRSVPDRSAGPTQVVYHAVQPTTATPAIPSMSVTASTDRPSSSIASSSTAAPTSSSQVSPPAYGANGALGPMSSPAG